MTALAEVPRAYDDLAETVAAYTDAWHWRQRDRVLIHDDNRGNVTFLGTIVRLRRVAGQDLATVHLDTGSVVDVDARELLEPCRSCGGEGARVRHTRGSIAPDPQTEEVCPRCEGDGIEPGDER